MYEKRIAKPDIGQLLMNRSKTEAEFRERKRGNNKNRHKTAGTEGRPHCRHQIEWRKRMRSSSREASSRRGSRGDAAIATKAQKRSSEKIRKRAGDGGRRGKEEREKGSRARREEMSSQKEQTIEKQRKWKVQQEREKL